MAFSKEIQPKTILIPREIKVEVTPDFVLDGRLPIAALNQLFLNLPEFITQEIFCEQLSLFGRKKDLPSYALTSKIKGPALWLLAGIHGEEPAGINAIARLMEQEFFKNLQDAGLPQVIFPLINPLGYFLDWRYPNESRDHNKGTSVGDSEHLLPAINNPGLARRSKPICQEAKAFTKKVISLAREYPPIFVLDLHEDEDGDGHPSYIYFHGEDGENQAIKLIKEILSKANFPMQTSGLTKDGGVIKGGVVYNLQDGSADELLASPQIIIAGQPVPGPQSPVLVLETPTNFPLSERVLVHENVIQELSLLLLS